MHYLFVVISALTLLFLAPPSLAKRCEISTPEFKRMETVKLMFVGKEQTFNVKFADTSRKRAAGFQYICDETIATESILFLFRSQIQPAFHMRNVVAALDIAFIDVKGKIVSIQTMQPYVSGELAKPTYSPKEPVIAALETYGGFFKEQGVDVGMEVRWSVK